MLKLIGLPKFNYIDMLVGSITTLAITDKEYMRAAIIFVVGAAISVTIEYFATRD